MNEQNGQQYKYEDNIWWHPCKNSEEGEINWNWNNWGWVAKTTHSIGVMSVQFCPWCGIELQVMPQAEGQE